MFDLIKNNYQIFIAENNYSMKIKILEFINYEK